MHHENQWLRSGMSLHSVDFATALGKFPRTREPCLLLPRLRACKLRSTDIKGYFSKHGKVSGKVHFLNRFLADSFGHRAPLRSGGGKKRP